MVHTIELKAELCPAPAPQASLGLVERDNREKDRKLLTYVAFGYVWKFQLFLVLPRTPVWGHARLDHCPPLSKKFSNHPHLLLCSFLADILDFFKILKVHISYPPWLNKNFTFGIKNSNFIDFFSTFWGWKCNFINLNIVKSKYIYIWNLEYSWDKSSNQAEIFNRISLKKTDLEA